MSKLTREQLGVKPGDQIVLKGEVAFARIDRPVEGAELERENARRASLGMMKADKPFRSITIKNPEIIQGDGTPLAQFHGQQVYQNKEGENAITLESKSLYPPSYGHIQNGQIVEIEDPKKNPATGQIVYLLIEAYEVKGFSNLGSTFNAIVFEEGEIKFYEGGSSAIKGFGQALGMSVQSLGSTQPAIVNSNDNAFNQNAGGFDQAQAPTQTQPVNPFGVQDSDVTKNTGQPTSSPFA